MHRTRARGRTPPLWLALSAAALLVPTLAAAECPGDTKGPCALPLIALPPALGVRVQGSAVAATAAFSLGVYSGPRTGTAPAPWLLSLDIGVAWVLPTTVEPFARASVLRLWRLGAAVEGGLGASLLWAAFDLKRMAGGPSALLQVQAGPALLRLSAQAEVGMAAPAFSLAVALVPW
jgi:hypothetical protein